MILAAFLSLNAHAAEVQVAMSTPIQVFIDGVAFEMPSDSMVITAPNLPPGKHTVETRTMFGKTTALKQIELGADEQIRYEYRKKELWEIGRYRIAPPPPPAAIPPATPSPASTTTTTTTVSTNGMPGMGISISDGQDTVSIGANFPGMGSSVTVTETTSTTTVVTDSPVHSAPVPTSSRYPFDPGAFEALHRQMRETPFDDDRTSFLKSATRANEMTVAQLKKLLSTYSHDDSKVEAVQIAAPAVMDPHNAFQLNDAFTFSSSANEAQAAFH